MGSTHHFVVLFCACDRDEGRILNRVKKKVGAGPIIVASGSMFDCVNYSSLNKYPSSKSLFGSSTILKLKTSLNLYSFSLKNV